MGVIHFPNIQYIHLRLHTGGDALHCPVARHITFGTPFITNPGWHLNVTVILNILALVSELPPSGTVISGHEITGEQITNRQRLFLKVKKTCKKKRKIKFLLQYKYITNASYNNIV